MKIAILSSSVRADRKSHRLALYFHNYLTENKLAEAEVLDLNEYNFPVFNERLEYMTDPLQGALEFAEKIRTAEGVIIVTPEYNGGYPAALKNAIDLLYSEWRKKPIAIAAVSDGQFGGTQVITSLVFTLWKIGVLLVPAKYHVPKVQELFDEAGNPFNRAASDQITKPFIDELIWCISAKNKMA